MRVKKNHRPASSPGRVGAWYTNGPETVSGHPTNSPVYPPANHPAAISGTPAAKIPPTSWSTWNVVVAEPDKGGRARRNRRGWCTVLPSGSVTVMLTRVSSVALASRARTARSGRGVNFVARQLLGLKPQTSQSIRLQASIGIQRSRSPSRAHPTTRAAGGKARKARRDILS